MLIAPTLYVGEDICHRIPVLERYGAQVQRARCSARELHEALSDTVQYSALMFHEDLAPIPADVLALARSYPSPLVLFENYRISYDPACFDLIIPALTPPARWLQSIQDTIKESRRLRQEVAFVRDQTGAQRSRLRRLLSNRIDINEIWRSR